MHLPKGIVLSEKDVPKNLVKKPKILVIGGGGREHALVWKLSQSPQNPKIYCIPGNPGIGRYAECITEDITAISKLCDIAKEKKIDITIVGPELPLSLGITDRFNLYGLKVFGPTKSAAQLESSKIFAKQLMAECNIPTSPYSVFYDAKKAKEFIKYMQEPIVIKANGLAAGKGVFVCDTLEDGIKAIDILLVEKRFGISGSTIIIEKKLEGEEISFMTITDGKTILPITSSQDHKALKNRDRGPNTGGMGAYSPVPLVNEELQKRIMDTIMIPAITGISEKYGEPYKGVLYAGIMLVDENPFVLEFNVRFGDPEAQPIMMRLGTDLLTVIQSCSLGTLDKIDLTWKNENAVCVVAASEGYPGPYRKGRSVRGLTKINEEDVKVFHSGTAIKDMKLVTNGGRVLGVTALGSSLSEAVTKAYLALSEIKFDGMYYRDDIALRGMGYEI